MGDQLRTPPASEGKDCHTDGQSSVPVGNRVYPEIHRSSFPESGLRHRDPVHWTSQSEVGYFSCADLRSPHEYRQQHQPNPASSAHLERTG